MRVFVIDKNKHPLDPCYSARARKLLKAGKAKVFKQNPFTIILVDKEVEESQDYQLKIDPGSKTTGLAILKSNRVIWAAELTHRGQQIRDALTARRQLRRGRRNRKTRYRKPRFLNRTRREGWLPPSLMSRVHNIMTWVNRLQRVCPITQLSQELVRFDTQAIQNPEITGVEYQQGELVGYEVREYLLEKWGRKCAYCGAKDTPLEVEHIQPKSKGGSNRVSNLTLACHACNQAKGNQEVTEFLSGKSNLLTRILKQAKAPLKDAAAVNSTRWALLKAFKATGLPAETGTGGQTKFNRSRQGLPKTHWLDAACVGQSTPEQLVIEVDKPLLIAAKGHGTRQRCRPDRFGFPKAHAPKAKSFQGFQTGDVVRAVIPKGKFAGRYTGRVAIRFRPSFRLAVGTAKPFDVHPKYLRIIHHADGYQYSF
ncbi:MAG: HNH endonuclease [Spirulina sp. SIO3F2]|nr:HNH endonuclease [Spirulina sp. SIO3F2]